MSIGEVLARLRTEFPDITISKLRFLEAEGLVEPQRTAAGYRKYTAADLTRLRYVLAAQRDYYRPLRVIREQLAGPAPGRGALLPVTEPGVPEPPDQWLSRADLLATSGLDEPTLTELERHGLVRDRAGRYDADALTIAQVARQNTPAASARAAELARELTALSQQLHAALVRVGWREMLGR